MLEIKVLGTGCAKCESVEKNAREALKELGIEGKITKVTDINEITEYVMFTPGLMVNGQVKAAGKIPTKDQIKKWIKEETNN